MSGIKLANGVAASAEATVDTNGNLHVVSPTTKTQAGYITVMGEASNPADAGGWKQEALDISSDARLRVGIDSLLYNLDFVGTNIPQGHILQALTTMTVAQAGGFLTLNSGNSVAVSTTASIRTHRTFPISQSVPTYAEFVLKFTNPNVSNKTIEWGLVLMTSVTAPLDGVFFRCNASGEFRGVVSYNGTETQTAAFTVIGDTNSHTFLIVVHYNLVRFYVDGALRDQLTLATDAPTQAAMTSVCSHPLSVRVYNASGAGPASAPQVLIGSMSCWLGDAHAARNWPTALAGNGAASYQTQPGVASGIMSNWTNSLAVSSFTLSNTAVGAATLGGLFQFANLAGGATDYALFGWTNTTATGILPARTLVITGCRISMWNLGAANAATPATTCLFALAVGSTAISLATGDSATTVGPRRIPVGACSIPISSAIGAIATPQIDTTFSTPLICPPGTLLHVIMRVVAGAATASQTPQGMVHIDGYFE